MVKKKIKFKYSNYVVLRGSSLQIKYVMNLLIYNNYFIFSNPVFMAYFFLRDIQKYMIYYISSYFEKKIL